MRDLNKKELSIISGGIEIVCTFSSIEPSCHLGILASESFIEGSSSLYEAAVEAATDLFEWMFGDEDSP